MSDGYYITDVGRIPVNWNVKPIGKIATVVRGASPRPKGDPRYYGGTIPRLMGTDVTRDGKYVTPQKDFLTKEGAERSRFLKAGTLVMICSGDVGVPTILAVDACIHDGFLAFPEISKECEIEYLYYIFDSFHQKFNSSATHGGVFTNLTTSIIKEFLIPIPPLSEQNKISAILSSVDEKIKIIEEQIKLIEELKKGLLQQLLTKGFGHAKFKDSPFGKIPEKWGLFHLCDIADSFVGIASSATHAYSNEGIMLIRNQNIKEGKLDLSDVLYINEKYEKQHIRKRLKEGDILTVRTGYPGISAVVPKELEGCQSFTTLITRIKHPSILSQYLCYFINSEFGKSFFTANQAGNGQQNVGSKTLEKLIIPIPELQEQIQTVELLSLVDSKIGILIEKNGLYSEYKTGLMQQLLTGKIRVTG